MKTLMMTTMLRAAVCVAVMALLAACGDDPGKTSTHSPSTAVTSSSSTAQPEDVMVTKTLLMDAVETRVHASVLDVDVLSPGVAKAKLAGGSALVRYAYTGPATLTVLSLERSAN